MGQPLTVPPPGFDELPVEDQIDYVQALWNRIFAHGQSEIRSPEWHREEVRAALGDHQADPTAARPWADVRADIEAKLKRHG